MRVHAKLKVILLVRRAWAARCRRLSGGAPRRNPDAAGRLGIVGGLNFKLEEWRIAGDNKQFASGSYEVF